MLSRKFKEIAAAAATANDDDDDDKIYHSCRHLIRDTFREFGVKFMHKWVLQTNTFSGS